MEIEGWHYYNHAAIPSVSPVESANMFPLENGEIWKISGGTPLLARWTTDFDCGYETNWWYVIKDTPFDINLLKAKRRYEINTALRNFDTKIINPCEYKEDLYRIQVAAFSAYPEKYRPKVNKNEFADRIDKWTKYIVFGAFAKESGKLEGYALLTRSSNSFFEFNVLKTNPAYEKYSVNAALVEAIVSHYKELLYNGGIICDGSRSINHETHFQDYLEKYFGFRKAYCKLHIAYNPKIKWIVKILFPIRKLLYFFDRIGTFHQINSVLHMEELCWKSK